MHCASLGEFEQGRPLLEKIKSDYPHLKILLTFFSPSGYEVRKHYSGADWVFYLPLDTKANVLKFLNIVKPQLAIFVKYEYWYNYLEQLRIRDIPVMLISALFRKQSIFFKWYGGLHRRMLSFFTHIYVQDEESLLNLKRLPGVDKVTRAGDTRFDRVIAIAAEFQPVEPVEKFATGRKILVAGSTWPDDEKNLLLLWQQNRELSLIIAPHEIHAEHIRYLLGLFPDAALYSALKANHDSNILNKHILIIDNIGMLSRLYRYGQFAYIGGGFNRSGIHNTLEAAVYGKPVIFGPNYQKFNEAKGLLDAGGAFTYNQPAELISLVHEFLSDPVTAETAGKAAGNFVRKNQGATQCIMTGISQIVSGRAGRNG